MLLHYEHNGCSQSRHKKVIGYRYEEGRRFNVLADDGPKEHLCTEDRDSVTCRNCLSKMEAGNA